MQYSKLYALKIIRNVKTQIMLPASTLKHFILPLFAYKVIKKISKIPIFEAVKKYL